MDLSEKEDNGNGGPDEERPYPPGLPQGTPTLRTPICELKGGHSSAVVAADWILGSDQVISASWDRTACVWDVNTGEMLHSLVGKNAPYCPSHPLLRVHGPPREPLDLHN